jgi:hypothetical protein
MTRIFRIRLNFYGNNLPSEDKTLISSVADLVPFSDPARIPSEFIFG